jgi:hypothetical protein
MPPGSHRRSHRSTHRTRFTSARARSGSGLDHTHTSRLCLVRIFTPSSIFHSTSSLRS